MPLKLAKESQQFVRTVKVWNPRRSSEEPMKWESHRILIIGYRASCLWVKGADSLERSVREMGSAPLRPLRSRPLLRCAIGSAQILGRNLTRYFVIQTPSPGVFY